MKKTRQRIVCRNEAAIRVVSDGYRDGRPSDEIGEGAEARPEFIGGGIGGRFEQRCKTQHGVASNPTTKVKVYGRLLRVSRTEVVQMTINPGISTIKASLLTGPA